MYINKCVAFILVISGVFYFSYAEILVENIETYNSTALVHNVTERQSLKNDHSTAKKENSEVIQNVPECTCGPGTASCRIENDFWTWQLKRVCTCYYPYVVKLENCTECDCGTLGVRDCSYQGTRKVCSCFNGYKPKNGECSECDCGKGSCSFDENGLKKCDCKSGSALKDGKCEECNCALTSIDNIECTFDVWGKKRCMCPDGYSMLNEKCADIDECLDTNICPRTTYCVNTIGYYDCKCKTGYEPRVYGDIRVVGCSDIDECKYSFDCDWTSTTCVNTIGSYECKCKKGYHSFNGNLQRNDDRFCLVDETSGWTIATWICGVLYTIILCVLLVVIKMRKKAR